MLSSDVRLAVYRWNERRSISTQSFSSRFNCTCSFGTSRMISYPRQVAMYLCRKYTETSFPAIGDKFGGRDHSTVIHASKTIEKKIKEDPYMQTTIEKYFRLYLAERRVRPRRPRRRSAWLRLAARQGP